MANFLFILIFLFMLIFIVLRIHNLIKNKNYPTKYYSCIITFVFIIGLIIYCFIDYINSFIIFCHFLAILLFGNIIFLVIKKIFFHCLLPSGLSLYRCGSEYTISNKKLQLNNYIHTSY